MSGRQQMFPQNNSRQKCSGLNLSVNKNKCQAEVKDRLVLGSMEAAPIQGKTCYKRQCGIDKAEGNDLCHIHSRMKSLGKQIEVYQPEGTGLSEDDAKKLKEWSSFREDMISESDVEGPLTTQFFHNLGKNFTNITIDRFTQTIMSLVNAQIHGIVFDISRKIDSVARANQESGKCMQALQKWIQEHQGKVAEEVQPRAETLQTLNKEIQGTRGNLKRALVLQRKSLREDFLLHMNQFVGDVEEHLLQNEETSRIFSIRDIQSKLQPIYRDLERLKHVCGDDGACQRVMRELEEMDVPFDAMEQIVKVVTQVQSLYEGLQGEEKKSLEDPYQTFDRVVTEALKLLENCRRNNRPCPKLVDRVERAANTFRKKLRHNKSQSPSKAFGPPRPNGERIAILARMFLNNSQTARLLLEEYVRAGIAFFQKGPTAALGSGGASGSNNRRDGDQRRAANSSFLVLAKSAGDAAKEAVGVLDHIPFFKTARHILTGFLVLYIILCVLNPSSAPVFCSFIAPFVWSILQMAFANSGAVLKALVATGAAMLVPRGRRGGGDGGGGGGGGGGGDGGDGGDEGGRGRGGERERGRKGKEKRQRGRRVRQRENGKKESSSRTANLSRPPAPIIPSKMLSPRELAKLSGEKIKILENEYTEKFQKFVFPNEQYTAERLAAEGSPQDAQNVGILETAATQVYVSKILIEALSVDYNYTNPSGQNPDASAVYAGFRDAPQRVLNNPRTCSRSMGFQNSSFPINLVNSVSTGLQEASSGPIPQGRSSVARAALLATLAALSSTQATPLLNASAFSGGSNNAQITAPLETYFEDHGGSQALVLSSVLFSGSELVPVVASKGIPAVKYEWMANLLQQSRNTVYSLWGNFEFALNSITGVTGVTGVTGATGAAGAAGAALATVAASTGNILYDAAAKTLTQNGNTVQLTNEEVGLLFPSRNTADIEMVFGILAQNTQFTIAQSLFNRIRDMQLLVLFLWQKAFMPR